MHFQQYYPYFRQLITMSSAPKTYKLQGLVTLLYRYRISPSAAPNQGCRRRDFFSSGNFHLGYGQSYMAMNQGFLRSFSGSTTREADEEKPQLNLSKDEVKKTQPALLVPDKEGFSNWVKWLMGSFLTLVVPLLKQKWEQLRGLEGKVEKVVEEVGVVAEMVENAATVAEKAASEVAEHLPDNTKIKQAALLVEHISSMTAQEAHLAQELIHKVGEVKQEVKEMETIAAPAIDAIVEPHHHQQNSTQLHNNQI